MEPSAEGGAEPSAFANAIDDLSIDDDEVLLRRVPHAQLQEIKDEQGHVVRIRPQGWTFNDNDDGSPMSVYLRSAVAALGEDEHSLLNGLTDFFLAGVAAAVVRAQGQRIVRDPLIEPEHSCGPAHAVVVGTKNGKRRRRMAEASFWVVGP